MKLLLLLLHVKLCVYVHCSDEQLSEMGKVRGIYGVVRNAYRMWSVKYKGPHQKPKPMWEDINTYACVRMFTHTHAFTLSQHISIHSEHLLQ